MQQATTIPVSNIKNISRTYSNTEDQFCELMTQIQYGINRVTSGKWNRAEYLNHMADFFDYLGLPSDAEEHRDIAHKWLAENSAL